jgi:putative FmdB family regulatory protein
MPIYDYECPSCGKRKEVNGHKVLFKADHWCWVCDIEMRRIPSLPASVRVGKYGKGGGK